MSNNEYPREIYPRAFGLIGRIIRANGGKLANAREGRAALEAVETEDWQAKNFARDIFDNFDIVAPDDEITMKKYVVDGAVSQAEGIKGVDNMSDFYDDSFDFMAPSDFAAFFLCDEFQEIDDQKVTDYLIEQGGSGDFTGGACYSNHLYRVCEDGSQVKIER